MYPYIPTSLTLSASMWFTFTLIYPKMQCLYISTFVASIKLKKHTQKFFLTIVSELVGLKHKCGIKWSGIIFWVFRGPVSIFYMVTVSVSTFCSSHSLLSPTEILSILKTLLYEKSFSTNGKEVWDDLSALHLLCTLLLYHFNAIYNEIMQLTIV